VVSFPKYRLWWAIQVHCLSMHQFDSKCNNQPFCFGSCIWMCPWAQFEKFFLVLSQSSHKTFLCLVQGIKKYTQGFQVFHNTLYQTIYLMFCRRSLCPCFVESVEKPMNKLTIEKKTSNTSWWWGWNQQMKKTFKPPSMYTQICSEHILFMCNHHETHSHIYYKTSLCVSYNNLA
jgi:hypothetical protein